MALLPGSYCLLDGLYVCLSFLDAFLDEFVFVESVGVKEVVFLDSDEDGVRVLPDFEFGHFCSDDLVGSGEGGEEVWF